MAQRKFFTAITALVDTNVVVATTTGATYSGTLVGISPDTLSLCLSGAKDGEGKSLHRVFLSGNAVAQILSVEKPFDLKALANRLEKVFPTMIRLYDDKGFIWVMDRVKVSETGVVEGSGPAAERVQKVYDQFVSEMKD